MGDRRVKKGKPFDPWKKRILRNNERKKREQMIANKASTQIPIEDGRADERGGERERERQRERQRERESQTGAIKSCQVEREIPDRERDGETERDTHPHTQTVRHRYRENNVNEFEKTDKSRMLEGI